MYYGLKKAKPNPQTVWTHYMQHHVVTKTRSAVNSDQDAILQGCTKADSQPICPGAWPLIGWPAECY